MSALKVDLGLVQKYNVPGPRYTSYPPATKFTEAVTWAEVEPRILENNRTEGDLSLYFHIPFCETLCWYCGCTTLITGDHRQGTTYISYLDKEVAQLSPRLNPRRKVVQLHWGGGSPTFLTPDEIRKLGSTIHGHFTLADDVEAGVEIDPRRLTREHVVALRQVGFNRASIGVQDFDPRVMDAVHRIQPRKLTEQVMGWARELGFRSVNFDLIYGLPHQTVDSFNHTLDQVLAMEPDRLAVFSYAHVPWVKPAQKILEDQKHLPPPEVKFQLLKTVVERLTEGGRYVYIGMDHFARPDDDLALAQQRKQLQRNFQGYSTRSGADIYGFGMSSISQIPDAYWQNEKDLRNYYAALDGGKAPLVRGCLVSEAEKVRRDVIMRVMCDLSLDYEAMSRRLGLDFKSEFAREIEALAGFEADGLVRRSAGRMDVTETGRLFIRNIAMCFDNALAPAGDRKHSKTI
jgi:oxygen-independent coproporphyrinogen III oxidase